MQFDKLAPEEIPLFWPGCRTMLKPAFRYRVQVNAVEDYLEPLKRGDAQLWLASDRGIVWGAVLTTIDTGSQGKVCTIHSMAGKGLKSWAAIAEKKITEFAKAHGCMALEAITRRGIAHYIRDAVEDGIVYVKLLEK